MLSDWLDLKDLNERCRVAAAMCGVPDLLVLPQLEPATCCESIPCPDFEEMHLVVEELLDWDHRPLREMT